MKSPEWTGMEARSVLNKIWLSQLSLQLNTLVKYLSDGLPALHLLCSCHLTAFPFSLCWVGILLSESPHYRTESLSKTDGSYFEKPDFTSTTGPISNNNSFQSTEQSCRALLHKLTSDLNIIDFQ